MKPSGIFSRPPGWLVFVPLLALATACSSLRAVPADGTERAADGTSRLADDAAQRAEMLAHFSAGRLVDSDGDPDAALEHFRRAIATGKAGNEVYLRSALLLLRKKNGDGALAMMADLRHHRPDESGVWMFSAAISQAMGRRPEAGQYLLEAIRLAPSNVPAYLSLAGLRMETNDVDGALAILREGAAREPDSERLLLAMGDTYLKALSAAQDEEAKRRRSAAAQAFFEDALSRLTHQPTLLEQAAGLYAYAGRTDRAFALAEARASLPQTDPANRERLAQRILSLSTDRPAALDALEKIAARTGTNALAYYYVGEFRLAAGAERAAMTAFRRATRLAPVDELYGFKYARLLVDQDPDEAITYLSARLLRNPNQNELRQLLGSVYLVKNQPAEALAQYGQVEESLTDETAQNINTDFYFKYALAAQGAGALPRAAELLGEAILLNPALLDSYSRYALSAETRSTLRQSIVVLGELARRMPENPRVPIFRGLLLGLAGRAPEAAASFRAAETIGARLPAAERDEIMTAGFYFWYASACERTGDAPQAESLLRRCLELDPKHADALNFLAYLWAEKNTNLAEALKYSRQSLAIDPGNSAYLDTLGWIYFRLGDLKKAGESIQAALEKLPADPTIREHYGSILERAGRLPEALAQWRRALRADPDNEALAAKLKAHDAGAEPPAEAAPPGLPAPRPPDTNAPAETDYELRLGPARPAP